MRPTNHDDPMGRLWEIAEQMDQEARGELADALSGEEQLTQSEITSWFDQIDPVDRAEFRDDLEQELGYGDAT